MGVFGIAGLTSTTPIPEKTLRIFLEKLKYLGPDRHVGLVHIRLSILQVRLEWEP